MSSSFSSKEAQGTPGISNEERERLLALAREVQQRAYAPYSKFQVGAAVLLEDGRVFTGCNVENASYGLTNCAERTAIFRAVAESASASAVRIRAIAVTNAAGVHCPPCGACRQVIAEFSSAETEIFYQGASGVTALRMSELLPDGFRL